MQINCKNVREINEVGGEGMQRMQLGHLALILWGMQSIDGMKEAAVTML